MRNITIDPITYPGLLALQPNNVDVDGGVILAPGMAYFTYSPDPNESTTGSINFYWAATNKPIFNDGPYNLTQLINLTDAAAFEEWGMVINLLNTAMNPNPTQNAFNLGSNYKGGLSVVKSDGVSISATLIATTLNVPAVLNSLVAANSTTENAFVKLYNLAAPPDPALDTPSIVLFVPPLGNLIFNPQLPLHFPYGLAMIIVGYPADGDDTPVQADGVIVTLGIKY